MKLSEINEQSSSSQMSSAPKPHDLSSKTLLALFQGAFGFGARYLESSAKAA